MCVVRCRTASVSAAWATVPYWLIMLVTVALFTVFPDIVLFVPNMFFP